LISSKNVFYSIILGRRRKMLYRQFKYSICLALLAILLLTSVAFAQGGPPRFAGRWVTIDLYDSSTINMTLSGPPGGPFRVNWTESYFSLCGSRFGRGRGTAEIIAPNTLSLVMDFECFKNTNTAHFEDTLTYDPVNNTLKSSSDPAVTGLDFFTRPGKP